jgi:hypothetical protein
MGASSRLSSGFTAETTSTPERLQGFSRKSAAGILLAGLNALLPRAARLEQIPSMTPATSTCPNGADDAVAWASHSSRRKITTFF